MSSAPAGFQALVEQLMRDGMLFGSAVLRARETYWSQPPEPPPPPDRSAISRKAAVTRRENVVQVRSRHSQAITEAKRAHWGGAGKL